jgi:hypothetical protein
MKKLLPARLIAFLLVGLLNCSRISAQCIVTFTDTSISLACGDSVNFGNHFYDTAGTYTDTLISVGGCDSIVTLQLSVSGDTTYLMDTICANTSLAFNGTNIDSAGVYVANLQTAGGCDSAVILHLILSYDTSACASLLYPNYWPMLDSVNIWQYVGNIEPEIAPPYNNNNGIRSLANACQYPLSTYPGGTSEFTEGDTVINGDHYKVLWASDYGVPCIVGFLREDSINRIVYFKDVLSTPEIVLYNFSLLVGQKIFLSVNNQYWNYPYGLITTGWYRLDSVNNVSLSSGVHREFYLNCDTCTVQNTLSWIEGVGNQVEVIYPYSSSEQAPEGNLYRPCTVNSYPVPFPYDYSQILSCFSHIKNVYFDSCSYFEAVEEEEEFKIIDSCDYFVSGINQIPDLNSFTLYPNPASNQITLSFDVNQSDVFEIEVLDMQGRQALPSYQVGRLNLGIQTREMNISTLASGFYLVACKSDKGVIYRKLVVRND